MVQAVSTSMMVGRGGQVKRAIRRETKHNSSASDRKFNVERATVERAGSEPCNSGKVGVDTAVIDQYTAATVDQSN
jgi:hypothetical protein